MNKYPAPPSYWHHIRIELEICGVVVNSVTATQGTFQSLRNDLTNKAISQPYHWEIFISRFNYKPDHKKFIYRPNEERSKDEEV